MLAQRMRLTTDDFWTLIETTRFQEKKVELIDGEIIEMSPMPIHGRISHVIQLEMGLFLRTNPLGKVFDEADCYVPGDSENTRRPDTCFVSTERLAGVDLNEPFPFMPDLIVEVKSPSNYYDGDNGLIAKAKYYLAHGSRLVWLADPVYRAVTVFTADAKPLRLIGDAHLTGGDVLPGFSLALSVIFEDV